MPAFDLAKVDGDNWDAAAVNAVEAAINLRRYIGTNAERLALGGLANGQEFYCTDTLIAWLYNGTRWIKIGPSTFEGEVIGATTNPQNTTAALVDLAGASVNIDVIAGVRYKATGSCMVASTVVGDVVQLAILANGVTIAQQAMYIPTAANNAFLVVTRTWVAAATATHAVKLQYGRYFGTGTISGRHDITPPYLLVERC